MNKPITHRVKQIEATGTRIWSTKYSQHFQYINKLPYFKAFMESQNYD